METNFDNRNDDRTKNFLRWLPVGYAAMILIGYLSEDTYYSKFHIDIIDYLDTSELLLIFIKKTNTVLILIWTALCYVASFLPHYFTNSKGKEYAGVFTNIHNRHYYKKTIVCLEKSKNIGGKYRDMYIKRSINTFLKILILLYFYLYPGIHAYIFLLKPTGNYWDILRIAGCLWIAVLFGVNTDKFKNQERKYYKVGIYFIIWITSFLIMESNSEAERLIKSGEHKKMIISSDANIIETNDSVFYIGETENYLFVNNRDTIVVLKRNDISKIEIIE